jgi:hypothetical protein
MHQLMQKLGNPHFEKKPIPGTVLGHVIRSCPRDFYFHLCLPLILAALLGLVAQRKPSGFFFGLVDRSYVELGWSADCASHPFPFFLPLVFFIYCSQGFDLLHAEPEVNRKVALNNKI